MGRFRLLFALTVLGLLVSGEATGQRAGRRGIRHEVDAVTALRQYVDTIRGFNSVFPQEKVWLQFDNTAYFIGEEIWFRAFVVTASEFDKGRSKILYVDLLSPSGKVLQHKTFDLFKGECDGSFKLMESSTGQARKVRGILDYPSGFYEIRAYTANMLNFSEETVFSRVFPVYEEPLGPGDYANSRLKAYDSSEPGLRPSPSLGDRVAVGFYPEGGNLVAGLPGRVAFKAFNSSGMGVDGTLRVVGAGRDGRDITASVLHDGMGSFSFTPGRREYKAVFTCDGVDYEVALPLASDSGYVMLSAVASETNVRVRLYRDSLAMADTLGLCVSCRGAMLWFDAVSFEGESGEFLMKAADWPEGVCRIVLFDRRGRVLASRHFYHRNQNVRPPVFRIWADKEKYNPYDKMKLTLQLVQSDSALFRTPFCLSVRDGDDYGQGSYGDDIRTSLLLSSDLKGYIHNPHYYFESDDTRHTRALDILTLVHGWERYEWLTMTGCRPFEERYLKEPRFTVSGTVLSRSGSVVMPGSEVSIRMRTADGMYQREYSIVTDTLGRYHIRFPNFYGLAEISLTALGVRNFGDKANTRIILDRNKYIPPRAYLPCETAMPDGTSFANPTVQTATLFHNRLVPAFQAFDVAADVDDALDNARFPMKLHEYLDSKGIGLTFIPRDSLNMKSARSDMEKVRRLSEATLINGSKVIWYLHNSGKTDYGKDLIPVWDIDTRNIESMIIYQKPMSADSAMALAPLLQGSMTGVAGRNASERYILVDMLLKWGSEIKENRSKAYLSTRKTTLNGLALHTTFSAPVYLTASVPPEGDWRRTLFWNPSLIPDENGTVEIVFYNNSYSRHFSVSGAGITASGTPYVLDATF